VGFSWLTQPFSASALLMAGFVLLSAPGLIVAVTPVEHVDNSETAAWKTDDIIMPITIRDVIVNLNKVHNHAAKSIITSVPAGPLPFLPLAGLAGAAPGPLVTIVVVTPLCVTRCVVCCCTWLTRTRCSASE
jgi:hypothetical protein